MRFLKSKLPGIMIMFAAFIMFIGIVWLTARTFTKTFFVSTPYMFLEGEYCIDKMNAHLFAVSLIVYFRSNLKRPVSRAVSGVIALLDTAAVITAGALHIFAVSDMVVTGVFINIIIGMTAVVFIVLLSMILWIPMIIALILDILNQFINFTGLHFFTYGLAVTMIAQIVRSVFDLRRKYAESIRYQQMQKELYEAKVQVMVSQIRPHFMYNALSSIAMLCRIRPETAYEATIKFSDYLRGNMDSLRQTSPVPFRKELEHLEKYLYIEKLRFGNFDVFLPDGTPLRFERSRAKEIFAYLVHRCGSRCSTKEIAAALFEDAPYDKTQQSYLQTLISAMNKSLKKPVQKRS